MLSAPDMAVIGVLALLFFGPDQLPKVAKRVGHIVREVQNTSGSFLRELERAADDHEPRRTQETPADFAEGMRPADFPEDMRPTDLPEDMRPADFAEDMRPAELPEGISGDAEVANLLEAGRDANEGRRTTPHAT